jgi:hypothetical protein
MGYVVLPWFWHRTSTAGRTPMAFALPGADPNIDIRER